MKREEAINRLMEYAQYSYDIWHNGEEDYKAFYMAIEALLAEAVQGEWKTGKPTESGKYMVTLDAWGHRYIDIMHYAKPQMPNREVDGTCWYRSDDEWGDVVYDDEEVYAWLPLPEPYKGGENHE